MSEPGLFFYCGVASLIYTRETSARPGPSRDLEFKILDFDGGLAALRSGDAGIFSGKDRCFSEMLEILGVDVEGYVSRWERTFGVFLEEETEQSWFCYFEAPLMGYPLSLNIFYRRAFDYESGMWVLDRCHIGIFPIPSVLYVWEEEKKAA